ncbi:MAG: hypothetical protein ACOC34_00450 [Thermotogota bacterium]
MKKFLYLLFMLVFSLSVFSAQYSDDYFGLSLEFQKIDFIDDFLDRNYFDQNNINFVFSYGPSFSSPVRFRMGIGVYDLSDYYLNGGLELKIFEFLNSVKGRFLGLYIIADLKLGLDYAQASLMGELFIHFSAVGGLQLGLGVNQDIQPLFTIAYSGGVYPLITK